MWITVGRGGVLLPLPTLICEGGKAKLGKINIYLKVVI